MWLSNPLLLSAAQGAAGTGLLCSTILSSGTHKYTLLDENQRGQDWQSVEAMLLERSFYEKRKHGLKSVLMKSPSDMLPRLEAVTGFARYINEMIAAYPQLFLKTPGWNHITWILNTYNPRMAPATQREIYDLAFMLFGELRELKLAGELDYVLTFKNINMDEWTEEMKATAWVYHWIYKNIVEVRQSQGQMVMGVLTPNDLVSSFFEAPEEEYWSPILNNLKEISDLWQKTNYLPLQNVW